MNHFLEEIIANKKLEVAELSKSTPSAQLKEQAFKVYRNRDRSLRHALTNSNTGIIAEVKRKSPTKGIFNSSIDAAKLAKEYCAAGVSAVSILTDTKYFGGSVDDVIKSRSNISVPILRKDFIVDPYQIYESRIIGADAILLIARVLSPAKIRMLSQLAHEVGLEVVLEVHSESEIVECLCDCIDIVGVNSRNLDTFTVDLNLTKSLASKIPSKFLKIAESGIKNSAIVRKFRKLGYSGFLIGENFVKSSDPGAACKQFVVDCEDSSERHIAVSPDKKGFYGRFGGAYIPEMLYRNVTELSESFREILGDSKFKKTYKDLLRSYVGRPTPLYFAERLSAHYGANIFLKREDLAHTGSHKINNALGQVLLAKQLGRTRIIAETGAGQHGVATATACALLGIPCVVYMGAVDVHRQALNVSRMMMLGAEVVAVESGSKVLKDAANEALRDWIAHPKDTHYVIGSVVGPHPFPEIVTHFQSVISEEIQKQLKAATGKPRPDMIIACVGGGSNAIGAFYHFIKDPSVDLVGVEAAGCGLNSGKSAATIALGREGILHGARTIVMQTEDGQISEAHSMSAGLDYPGIGPIHAHLNDIGRVEYLSVTDDEALGAARFLAKLEGIIPALESVHAVAALEKVVLGGTVVVNISGRGDKDMETYGRCEGVCG